MIGYPNERGIIKRRPRQNETDYTLNGTYVVFRQLEQNVEAFKEAVTEAAKRLRGHNPPSEEDRDWVAERMMGRKKNGDPLVPLVDEASEEDNKQPVTSNSGKPASI